jgi:hypothetical protein
MKRHPFFYMDTKNWVFFFEILIFEMVLCEIADPPITYRMVVEVKMHGWESSYRRN